ncbi:MAG: quinoprotein dehydrogenase-associated putative ABC transporter substrate-binding protein [Woeseiaceae bacterium]
MSTRAKGACGVALLLAGLGLSAHGFAQERPAFRVCADPNNLPLSAKSLSGYENRIAKVWADELDLPLEYTWFPQRRGFVRNTLRAPNGSGSGYKCDVVMGVAAGSDELLTTKPYYRSTYALVYERGRDLDGVSSGADFIGLPRDLRDRLRIGAFTPTPGVRWLARHGMIEQLVAFPAMSGDPDAYPGEIIEKELVGGRLDAAIVWGPVAGYFASRAQGTELVLIPLESEPGIVFEFSIAAGVRYGDGERKRQLEELIDRTSASIHAILAEYGVPLLAIGPNAQQAAQSADDDH